MKHNVTFNSQGLKLAANLYIPDNYQHGERRPAILVSHPLGGVKEQTAGLYASRLAQRGFVTLAYDASYQGESEGQPHFLEDPYHRVEDVKSAVSYLSTLEQVDPARIGALGICASGAYVPCAAATERRIRAVASVSAIDAGAFFRSTGGTDAGIKQMLQQAGEARTAYAQGNDAAWVRIFPQTQADITKDTSVTMAEAYDYYRTPRAQHPNAQNRLILWSIDKLIGFSAFDFIHLISPHPVLFIAGTQAESAPVSEQAYAKAQEPKELFWVEGATHMDLYDREVYVGPVVEKLISFYRQHLA